MARLSRKAVRGGISEFLSGTPENQEKFVDYAMKYMGAYRRDRGRPHQIGMKSGPQDKRKLIRSARQLDQVHETIQGLGVLRLELLLETYENDNQVPDSFSQFETPDSLLNEEVNAVKRLALRCRKAAGPSVRRGRPPEQSEVQLCTRIGHRALELKVLKRLGRRSDSIYYRLCGRVLELSGYHIQNLEDIVARSYTKIYEIYDT